MNIPQDLKYTASHEWLRLGDDGVATVGITDHAQEQLGDVVFVELPEIGRKLKAGEECAVVESVKAASDIYAPVAGEIVEVNQSVVDAPESVNADAYAAGLYRIRPDSAADVASLLDAAGYQSEANKA